VLQKEKAGIPDFDAWYERWREIMAKDAVLAWSLEARNHIVHAGDLETFSTATAGIQASWDEPETVTFEVPPLMPTLAIAGSLAEREIPEEVRKGGLLRVERRWVAADLRDWELLEALAHAYELLAHLIRDAHRQAGAPLDTVEVEERHEGEFSTDAGGLPPCMVATEELRTVIVNLRTNEILERKVVPIVSTSDSREEARKRYRFNVDELPRPTSSDPLDLVPFYMEIAKGILKRDKWHAEFAFLLHPGGLATLTARPADQQEKYLFMNDVANEVRRLGATGVVLIADTWWLENPDDLPKGKRPGEVKERREGLMVMGLRSDGERRVRFTSYRRRLGRIQFDDAVEVGADQSFFLAPVLRAWGLSVPSEQEALERMYGDGLEREGPTP
jgi:hypothetical protein